EATRLRGEPQREPDEVRKALVALALEVVLGRPERVVAEVVHELRDVARGEERLAQRLVAVAPGVGGGALEPDVLELDLTDIQDVEPFDHRDILSGVLDLDHPIRRAGVCSQYIRDPGRRRNAARSTSLIALPGGAAGGRRRSATPRLPAPDLASGLHEEVELPALVVPGDLVAGGDRGKAALRAQRETGERHVPRRLVDAPEQILLGLQPRDLGGDQPEDHRLAPRDVAQRREAAGALAVVLQQEAVVGEVAEDLLGDPVVAALGEPATPVVAATHVQAEG